MGDWTPGGHTEQWTENRRHGHTDHAGEKPVTVQVKKLGDDGKPLQNEHGGWIYVDKEVTRNQWEARHAVDLYVVARHTGQLAQPGELCPYHLGDFRVLQAAVDD